MIPYLEAPNYLRLNEYESKSVFLAGSITGAWNWQNFAKNRLMDAGFQVINPRREGYDTLVEGIEEEQIIWEWNHLDLASTILFWFSNETLAPITLFELGTLCEAMDKFQKAVYIGIDPEYKRKRDIEIQLKLRAPSFNNFFDNIDEMVYQIIDDNA